jgi:predicted membrane protein
MWHSRYHAMFWGFALILAGLLFWAHNMGRLDFGDLLADYWPVLIILGGLYIVLVNLGRSKVGVTHGYKWDFGDRSVLTDDINVIQSNVFGDVKVTIDSKDFQGGRIRTVFGDVKVDLSNMDISSGERTLYLTTTFGDVKVEAPKDIPVAVRASNTFGDMNVFGQKRDGFGQQMSYKSEGYDAAKKKLAIVTSQVFGDVRVW